MGDEGRRKRNLRVPGKIYLVILAPGDRSCWEFRGTVSRGGAAPCRHGPSPVIDRQLKLQGELAPSKVRQVTPEGMFHRGSRLINFTDTCTSSYRHKMPQHSWMTYTSSWHPKAVAFCGISRQNYSRPRYFLYRNLLDIVYA